MIAKAAINLDDLLSPEQLCEKLQVKASWIYRQVREESIPYTKVGKYLRFYRPEIEKWLAEHTVSPTS